MSETAAAATARRAPSEDDPRGDLRWGTIPGLVADAAERFGEREALVDGDLRLSFSELADRALEVTRAAIAIGIEPGDRVGIWAPNSAAWVVAALGMVGAGAVLVPVNTRFKGAEAAHILRSSEARVLFTVQSFLGVEYPAMLAGEDLPDLERIILLHDTRSDDAETADTSEITRVDEVPVYGWHEFLAAEEGVVESATAVAGRCVNESSARERWRSVAPTDLSDLMFTSGTTGSPKGAMTTHRQCLRTFATWASIVGLREGDRYLVVNPFFHTFGYKAGILACLMQGATLVPVNVFDVDRVLEPHSRGADLCDSRASDALPIDPRAHTTAIEHDLSSLRLAVTGAAVVPVELVKRMGAELGFETVLTAYGLTESTGVVTMCRQADPPEVIASTSGRAIPGLEVRVVDADGSEAATRAAG